MTRLGFKGLNKNRINWQGRLRNNIEPILAVLFPVSSRNPFEMFTVECCWPTLINTQPSGLRTTMKRSYHAQWQTALYQCDDLCRCRRSSMINWTRENQSKLFASNERKQG